MINIKKLQQSPHFIRLDDDVQDKPSWRRNILISGAEMRFFHDARYNDERRSELHYITGLYADKIAAENPMHGIQFEANISEEWHRRFREGLVDKTTGQTKFCRTSQPRIRLLIDALEQESYLPQTLLKDHHQESCFAISKAKARGYNKLGNSLLLGSSFRGLFVSENRTKHTAEYSMLVIGQIGDENIFRVRRYKYIFVAETDTAIDSCIENFDNVFIQVHDTWAKFGTNEGVIFSRKAVSQDHQVSNFKFMSKGRRCYSMTMPSIDGNKPDRVFNLVRSPQEIEFALELLYAIP